MNKISAHIGTVKRPEPIFCELNEMGFQVAFDTILPSAYKKSGVIPTVSTNGLFDTYLSGFPAEKRQHHNCNACRAFFDRYGGMVVIGEDGRYSSLLFSTLLTPNFHYNKSIYAVADSIASRKVDGFVVVNSKQLGDELKNGWGHFYIDWSGKIHAVNDDGVIGVVNKHIEHYQTLSLNLKRYGYSLQNFQKAKMLAMTKPDDTAPIMGRLDLMLEVLNFQDKVFHRSRVSNKCYDMVATYPLGTFNVASGAVGNLIDMVNRNMDDKEIMQVLLETLDPMKYRRVVAAPKAGNIAAAARIFKDLGLESAVDRRYATLDEIKALWEYHPKRVTPQQKAVSDSVFSAIAKKPAQLSTPEWSSGKPSRSVSFKVFVRDIAPMAEEIFFAATRDRGFHFMTFTTAAKDDANPILRWDQPFSRNPVAWYTRPGANRCAEWNVPLGSSRVLKITESPNMWNGPENSGGYGAQWGCFIVQNARDVNRVISNALFPAHFRQELKEVEHTIETLSKTKTLSGYKDSVAGVIAAGGTNMEMPLKIIIRNSVGVMQYLVDRFE